MGFFMISLLHIMRIIICNKEEWLKQLSYKRKRELIMNMKQLTRFTLAGAIALGGLGISSMTDLPIPGLHSEEASAAYYADYNGKTLSFLKANVSSNPIWLGNVVNKPVYYLNNVMSGQVADSDRFTSIDIKIYLKKADGTVQRYKTMLPTYAYVDWGKAYDYSTVITTGFPKGNYIAVHSTSWDYPGGEQVASQEYKEFSIQ